MKTSVPDRFSPISIISFPSSFDLGCDMSCIQEDAAMCLLQFPIKKRAVTALNPRISLIFKLSHKPPNEGALATNCEMLHSMLETYTIEDVIAETNAEMMRPTQPLNKTPIYGAQLFWAEALR